MTPPRGTVRALPHDAVAAILSFHLSSLKSVLVFALVSKQWRAVAQDEEPCDAWQVLSRLLFPQKLSHSRRRTVLTHMLAVSRGLDPIKRELLTPIEQCPRADCPCFGEELENCGPPRPGLRRVPFLRCHQCSQTLRVHRNADSVVGRLPVPKRPFAIATSEYVCPVDWKHDEGRTYDIPVLDTDGVSARRFLRHLRNGVGRVIYAHCVGLRGSMRLYYASCVHQYRLVPETLPNASRPALQNSTHRSILVTTSDAPVVASRKVCLLALDTRGGLTDEALEGALDFLDAGYGSESSWGTDPNDVDEGAHPPVE